MGLSQIDRAVRSVHESCGWVGPAWLAALDNQQKHFLKETTHLSQPLSASERGDTTNNEGLSFLEDSNEELNVWERVVATYAQAQQKMLHEILLALAGHPSSLLEPGLLSDQDDADINTAQLFSVSERQLLNKLGVLSRLHRRLRHHLDGIVEGHPSMICRAVANTIRQTHLERYQAQILDVESKILCKDTNTVGAYDIVPLAYVVEHFDDWYRKMAWYWALAVFILPIGSSNVPPSTGAALINKLRDDAQTGFPQIEKIATELSRTAELAWLKQLAAWVLYGDITPQSKHDFFIQLSSDQSEPHYHKSRDLLPRFVSDATASSILFIGKSLNHMRRSNKPGAESRATTKSDDLVREHMELLTDITPPITTTHLARNISIIRASLSRNVLQDVLPIHTTRTALSCLRKYFLLSDSDFASCLVNETERQMSSRWQKMDRLALQDPLKALQGLSMKDTETNQVLRQTLKTMASRDSTSDDDTLEFASKHLSLTRSKKAASRPTTSDSTIDSRAEMSSTAFNDLLFASPTNLLLSITPPLDLFLSEYDTGVYSAINAYLVSIRRAQLRLEDLWRHNSARRSSTKNAGSLQLSRQHASANRKVWITCSTTLLLLSELAAYLETDIIRPSYEHFESWACKEIKDANVEQSQIDGISDVVYRDPETLAAGHRVFLDSLTYDLMLTDIAYTKDLRSLLGINDHLTSLFVRLLDLRRGRDDEEHKIQKELNRVCVRVDSESRGVVSRLQQLHQERIGPARYLESRGRDAGVYEACRSGGLDHLLVKLQYDRMSEHDNN